MPNFTRPPYPYKICKHCGYKVGMNSYVRNHGDKCPYKDAKPNHKFCKICGREFPLSDFNKVSSRTYDGLNQACKECASIKNIVCPHCNENITTKYIDHRLVTMKGKPNVISEEH